jgi:hypothetical protein
MSKVNKKSTKRSPKCKHVFKQGDKKGTKCGNNCRGEFCKLHNKTKKEYEKKRYEKIVEKKKEQDRLTKVDPIIEKINTAKNLLQLPRAMDYEIKRICYKSEQLLITRKYYAISVFLGLISQDQAYIKCQIDKLYDTGTVMFDKRVEKCRNKSDQQIQKNRKSLLKRFNTLSNKIIKCNEYVKLINEKHELLKKEEDDESIEELEDPIKEKKPKKCGKMLTHRELDESEELEISDTDIDIEDKIVEETPKKKYIEI